MTEALLNRAIILIEQRKYVEAEKVLQDLFSSDPNDLQTITLLSEVKLQLDKVEDADTLINTAIGLYPDLSHLFYIKAKVAIAKEKYNEAETHIEKAIELDANEADYFALWASIKLSRKQYEKALTLANQSLELDAENILGLNTRSTALLKLNNKEDSFKTIEGALKEDPTNAYTHANYGWGLLEKGEHKKALEHFREALKNNPHFDYAQAGMVEALKAKSPFYRLFLKYSFWINNLTQKYQWGVIIGFYILFRIIKSMAKNNEFLQPYLNPLLILLALLAFSTWVIMPLSNLTFRLNQYGKYLLSKKEIMSSNFVAVSLLLCIIGLISYLLLTDQRWLTIAVFGFTMMLPLGVMFSPTKFKNALVIYAGIMMIVGMLAIFTTFQTDKLFNFYTVVYIFGFVAYQWFANYLLIKQDNV